MIISIIAAFDERQAIGQNNSIPWRQQADMARFRMLTAGHHVVMGRRTYESLPLPRVLPDRTMIVLSTNDRFIRELPSHVIHQRSIFSAIEYAQEVGETELFLIGGWEVYMMGLMFADRLHLTRINTRTLGKVTKFPDIAWNEWEERRSIGPYPADEQNQYPYRFEVYERKPSTHVERLPRPARTRQGYTMVNLHCGWCKEPFSREAMYVNQKHKKGQTDHYCSRHCSAQAHAAQYSVLCTCARCGIQFKRAKSMVQGKILLYCSVPCMKADGNRAKKLKKQEAK